MNILSLTFWSYKSGLIQTYTLPYLRQIAAVIPDSSFIYLVTLEKDSMAISASERTSIDNELLENKIKLMTFTYSRFGIKAALVWLFIMIKLFFIIFTRRISTIHSFCTPPSVAALVLSKLTFRRLVIDSYEPHAEASFENGDWSRSSFKFRFLFMFEKFISRGADVIISATQGMREYARVKYNATFDKFYVKPACVDLDLFSKDHIKDPVLLKELGLEDSIVAVYAGKFGGIYLDQEVFDFFKVAQDYWGYKFKVLLLTNQADSELEAWSKNSHFNMKALIKIFVLHSEVPKYMGLGDFGLTPVKPIPTKRYCTPIKNGEYWALGLPIVSTANISDDSEIIEENNIGAILKKFDSDEYLRCIKKIDAILINYESLDMYSTIRDIAEKYRSLEISKNIYKEVYALKGAV